MKGYFVISNTEDGGYFRFFNNKEELLNEMKENESTIDSFFSGLPNDDDINYWEKTLIIKGEIVFPEEKKVVTELDI